MVSNDWLTTHERTIDPLEQHCRDVVDKTWNFSGRVETSRDNVMNAVLGLGGEAGEIVDFHKKLYYHKLKGEPEEAMEELKLELGDLCYYLAKLLDLYGFTLQEILEANKRKLFKRHNVKE